MIDDFEKEQDVFKDFCKSVPNAKIDEKNKMLVCNFDGLTGATIRLNELGNEKELSFSSLFGDEFKIKDKDLRIAIIEGSPNTRTHIIRDIKGVEQSFEVMGNFKNISFRADYKHGRRYSIEAGQ